MRSVTMNKPNAITAIQDAYVRKVIDTLNEFPNVLWIVSQEAPAGSKWWNSHLIAVIRAHEAGKPLQHPTGYGVLEDSNDATILQSDADWVAPAARFFPANRSAGSGHPRRKVIVNDSDHSYFGMWNESPLENRKFFWINFTNGNHTMFMDPLWSITHARAAIFVCLLLTESAPGRTSVGKTCVRRWVICVNMLSG